MNQWKTAAFALSLLWICSTVIIFQYHHTPIKQVANQSFQEGFTAGNLSGYTYGWKAGWEDGNRTGYRNGYYQGNRTGYREGFQAGNDSGYSLGWRNSWKNFQFSGLISDPDTTVSYSGQFEMDGYHFSFREDLGKNGDYSRTAFTWTHNDTVVLENGWSAKSMEGSCDHELAHNFFPGFDHPDGDEKFNDPIYNYSDDMDIRLCDRVVAKALEY